MTKQKAVLAAVLSLTIILCLTFMLTSKQQSVSVQTSVSSSTGQHENTHTEEIDEDDTSVFGHISNISKDNPYIYTEYPVLIDIADIDESIIMAIKQSIKSSFDTAIEMKILPGSHVEDGKVLCTDHEFIESSPIVTYQPIQGYPYHIGGFMESRVCEKCGIAEFGDISYKLYEHHFHAWRLTGNNTHNNNHHDFEYESYCSVCQQYCLRTVSLPCDGNGYCVSADKLIYD